MSREKDMELIAQGQCVSDLTVDRCVYCVDTCKASESRKRLKELLDSTGVDTAK